MKKQKKRFLVTTPAETIEFTGQDILNALYIVHRAMKIELNEIKEIREL